MNPKEILHTMQHFNNGMSYHFPPKRIKINRKDNHKWEKTNVFHTVIKLNLNARKEKQPLRCTKQASVISLNPTFSTFRFRSAAENITFRT